MSCWAEVDDSSACCPRFRKDRNSLYLRERTLGGFQGFGAHLLAAGWDWIAGLSEVGGARAGLSCGSF